MYLLERFLLTSASSPLSMPICVVRMGLLFRGSKGKRMNQFGPITLNIENFLEILEEGPLSSELCLRWTLNAFLGKTLAKSLEVSMSFLFKDITICYQENKVSIIFLASRKNYIHKLLPVATASTMLLRLLSSFFYTNLI